jgi:RimJ/RimL family protein N-acetyltransferase
MTTILETPRLTIRPWKHDDAGRLFEICSDEEVMKYIGNGKAYKTLSEAEKILEWAVDYQKANGFCRWAVLEKYSGEIIGSCGFAHPYGTEEIELGYLFARDQWSRGFATEAARQCMLFGFKNLGFREIIAITDLENTASRKVLEKIGFRERGVEIFENEEALVYLAENKI